MAVSGTTDLAAEPLLLREGTMAWSRTPLSPAWERGWGEGEIRSLRLEI
jgi:hypothetical protein